MKKSLLRIIEKINNREPLTSEEKKEYILYSLTVHGDDTKMSGIASASTSCRCNEYCQARQNNPDFVCAFCYADQYIGYRESLRKKLETNTTFYSEYELNCDDIPFLNCAVFRWEAFGDIRNTLQAINYLRITAKNNHVKFAWWSKNPWIIHNALQHEEKPDNLVIVLSNPKIDDKPIEAGYIPGSWPFVDKYFSVYTKEYAKANNITINCGGNHCLQCMICYDPENTTQYVNELLK